MRRRITLMIVDDSKVMRDALCDMFADDTEIDIVAQAENGVDALEKMRLYNPDVVTLDVSMPVMDGLTALKHIMIESPRPVVMLSSLTMEGAKVAFEALRYGAVDFISKPSAIGDTSISEQEAEIRSKIEYAASVEIGAVKYIRNSSVTLSQMPVPISDLPCDQLVVMGGAEGSYGALLKIIPNLKHQANAAYLVTLYVAPEHLSSFATYLNEKSEINVRCAVHGEILHPGVCYLSSGADYMTVHSCDNGFKLHISPAPFASRKGAIDMLMFSAADLLTTKCTAVLLSGLGADGAEGLEEVLHMGGNALVQDPKTCFCKEMATTAIERNALARIVTDVELSHELVNSH